MIIDKIDFDQIKIGANPKTIIGNKYDALVRDKLL
jgi:hypothetical protein